MSRSVGRIVIRWNNSDIIYNNATQIATWHRQLLWWEIAAIYITSVFGRKHWKIPLMLIRIKLITSRITSPIQKTPHKVHQLSGQSYAAYTCKSRSVFRSAIVHHAGWSRQPKTDNGIWRETEQVLHPPTSSQLSRGTTLVVIAACVAKRSLSVSWAIKWTTLSHSLTVSHAKQSWLNKNLPTEKHWHYYQRRPYALNTP